jgi:hypothetical protein
MPPRVCDELLATVKQYLSFLFEDFGFTVTTVKPVPEDWRCLIVLSSGQCRFRIIDSQGDLEFAVGPLSAPISWEDTLAGVTQWYYVKSALDYVRGKKYLDLATLRRPMPLLSFQQEVAKAASDLKPDCGKVVQLFGEDTFMSERRELDQFLWEQGEHLQAQLDGREWKKGGQQDHQET